MRAPPRTPAGNPRVLLGPFVLPKRAFDPEILGLPEACFRRHLEVAAENGRRLLLRGRPSAPTRIALTTALDPKAIAGYWVGYVSGECGGCASGV
jgi:hypothetical protein